MVIHPWVLLSPPHSTYLAKGISLSHELRRESLWFRLHFYCRFDLKYKSSVLCLNNVFVGICYQGRVFAAIRVTITNVAGR